MGWEESTLFLYGLGLYGDNPSDNVGDFQAVSSIAASEHLETMFEALVPA